MKKAGAVILIICLLTGGLGYRKLDPENRVYPLTMGFDFIDGNYQVFYDIPDMGKFTGDSKGSNRTDRVWSFLGTGSAEIQRQIACSKKETPDMGHVQVILLGERLLTSEEKYQEVLYSFLQEPALGSGAYVLVCKDLPQVMNAGAENTDALGAYIVDLLDKSPQIRPVILQDLYNAYYNRETFPALMEVAVQDGEIVVRNEKERQYF